MANRRLALDSKAEKLLKQVQQALDEMLDASSGTALSVAHPRVVEAINQLANHRYSQIGVSEPLPRGRQVVHTSAEKSDN